MNKYNSNIVIMTMSEGYKPGADAYDRDELRLAVEELLGRGSDDRRAYYKRNMREIKRALLGILGDKCVRCGFDDYRALQFDHKLGGGNLDFASKGKGPSYYRYYIKSPDEAWAKLQVLCANCNMIKKFANEEYHGRMDWA